MDQESLFYLGQCFQRPELKHLNSGNSVLGLHVVLSNVTMGPSEQTQNSMDFEKRQTLL